MSSLPGGAYFDYSNIFCTRAAAAYGHITNASNVAVRHCKLRLLQPRWFFSRRSGPFIPQVIGTTDNWVYRGILISYLPNLIIAILKKTHCNNPRVDPCVLRFRRPFHLERGWRPALLIFRHFCRRINMSRTNPFRSGDWRNGSRHLRTHHPLLILA